MYSILAWLIPGSFYSGLNIIAPGVQTAIVLFSLMIVFVSNKSDGGYRRFRTDIGIVFGVLGVALITVFLLQHILSPLFNVDEHSHWYYKIFIKCGTYILIGYLVCKIGWVVGIKQILLPIIVFGFASSVFLGVLQYSVFGHSVLMPSYTEYAEYTGIKDRYFSWVNPDPNFAAVELMFLFFVSGAYYNFERSKFVLFVSIAALLLILLTQSRSAYLSLLVAFCFVFFLSARLALTTKLVVGFLLFFSFVFLSLYLFGSSVDSSATVEGRFTSVYNYILRLESWYALYDYSGFGFFLGASGADPREVIAGYIGVAITPHNEYVSLLFNFGLIFLLAYLYVLYWLFSSLLLRRKYDKKSIGRGGFSLLLVCSMISHSIMVTTVSVDIGFAFAVLSALVLLFKNNVFFESKPVIE